MAAAGYAALVVLNRAKYGDAERFADRGKDAVLDQFIPNPEVAEHHQINIQAPVHIVMATAKSLQLMRSPLIRGIIRARELALGGEPDTRSHPSSLYDQMISIGCGTVRTTWGNRLRIGHPALGGGADIPVNSRGPIPRLLRARLCEDRVDLTSRAS